MKKLPAISTPEISVPCPKHPTTYPHPERDQSSPRPPMLFNIHFKCILPSTPRSSKWSFSFTFPRQNLTCISLSSHTCPMSWTVLSRSPRNIIGKMYKSSSCSLHSLVSDHSKIHKVPVQHFSLWFTRTDRLVQETRFGYAAIHAAWQAAQH